MAFERFTQTGKSYKAKISLRANGQMGFSQGAIEKFNLRDFKYAVLFYDAAGARIGIKLTNDNSESGVIALRLRKTNAYIAVRPFLDFYGIDYAKTRSYVPVQGDDNGLIVMEVEKA